MYRPVEHDRDSRVTRPGLAGLRAILARMSAPWATRRAVLASGLASGAALAGTVVVSGCRTNDSPATEPGDDTLIAALADEDELIRLYDGALATSSDSTLAVIRDHHVAHRAALLAALGRSSSPTATPSPSASEPAAAPTQAHLLAAETAANRRQTRAAAHAPHELTPLLASIAASEATHGVLLRAGR